MKNFPAGINLPRQLPSHHPLISRQVPSNFHVDKSVVFEKQFALKSQVLVYFKIKVTAGSEVR